MTTTWGPSPCQPLCQRPTRRRHRTGLGLFRGGKRPHNFIVCVRCFSANPVRINTSSVIELTLSGSLPWTYGSGETGCLTLWGALVSQTNFALSTQNMGKNGHFQRFGLLAPRVTKRISLFKFVNLFVAIVFINVWKGMIISQR